MKDAAGFEQEIGNDDRSPTVSLSPLGIIATSVMALGDVRDHLMDLRETYGMGSSLLAVMGRLGEGPDTPVPGYTLGADKSRRESLVAATESAMSHYGVGRVPVPSMKPVPTPSMM